MRREARDTVGLILGNSVTAALNLGYVVAAGRLLGPIESADFFAAQSLVYIVSNSLAPINGTIARFASLHAAENQFGKIRTLSREITRRLILAGGAGVLLGIALLPYVKRVFDFETSAVLLLTYAATFVVILLNVPQGMLRGVQRFRQYNGNTILEAGLRCLFAIVLLWFIPRATCAILAYFLSLTVAYVYARRLVEASWREYEPAPVDGRAVRRFAYPMFLFAFAAAGFQNVDMLFVKYAFDAQQVGQYGAASTLSRVINILFTPFNIMLLPMLTSLYVREPQRSSVVYWPMIRAALAFFGLALVPLLLFWGWSTEVVTLAFGKSFQEAAPYLLPLSAGLLLGALARLIGQGCAALSRFGFLAVYVLGLAAEMLGLSLWHESLQSVITVVVAAKALTLAGMLAIFVYSSRYKVDETPERIDIPA